MAQAISSYLKLNMENKILVHWACYKVEQKHLNTSEVATVEQFLFVAVHVPV